MSQVPAEPVTDETVPQPAPAAAKTAGVATLIRGNRSTASPKTVASRSHAPPIPRWYLFGGDLLLVALALLIAFRSPSPLNWQRVLFCSVVVALGAGLAIVALGTGQPVKSTRSKSGPFSGEPKK